MRDIISHRVFSVLVVAVIGAYLLVSAAGAATAVLPLGDSITRGDASQGYRLNLWTQMVAGNNDVDLIGSLDNGGPTGFDRQHEGHSGYTVQQVADALPGWLKRSSAPDVVLLHIGTNDLTRSRVTQPAVMQGQLGRIIETLRARNPSVRIYVAQIVPARDAAANRRIVEYNGLVRQVASRYTTSRAPVTVVDMYTGFDRTADLSADGIHPSRAGYRKMAARWYAAIRPALVVRRPTLTPTPTVATARPYARNAIPGTVEAENYDIGGEGVAFHDTTATNEGGALRRDGVDITTVRGVGTVVGYMRAGEWLRYTVAVARAGVYTVSLRTSSPYSGTSIRLEAAGRSTVTVPIPNTNSHERFVEVKSTIRLPAGTTTLRIVPSGHQNLDRIVFAPS